MAFVNFKELRKTAKPTYETITVETWGGDVTIKALNVVALTKVFQTEDAGERLVYAVLQGVVNEKQKRVFKDNEFDVVAELDAEALIEVGTKIIELSQGDETPKND